MLCLLLMLNSRILGLIWRGRAYFVVNETTIFLPGEWRQRSKSELPKRTTSFWLQIKSLKTSNVQIYPFVNLSMSLPNYKSLCLLNNECLPGLSEKRCPTSMAFWHQADWHTNLPPFQGARPDHVRVESSSCCFPRALWSFDRPRASWRFDPWHVTHSPPIRKRIWVGRYNNSTSLLSAALINHRPWPLQKLR